MIVIDARGECLALSLYHLNEEACAKFSERDTLIVMDPVLKPIDFAHGDRVRGVLSVCCMWLPSTSLRCV
jgi:hypothetical protein